MKMSRDSENDQLIIDNGDVETPTEKSDSQRLTTLEENLGRVFEKIF